jgi:hypothetical protein
MCFVNNELTKDIHFEAPAMQHVTLGLTCDSTHFTSGTSCEVEFWFLKLDGTWVHNSDTAPIKNNAFAWELDSISSQTGGHASETVQTEAELANWNTGESHSFGWTHEDVFGQLEGSGVHYVNSHANPLDHWTGNHWTVTVDGPDTEDAERIYGQPQNEESN